MLSPPLSPFLQVHNAVTVPSKSSLSAEIASAQPSDSNEPSTTPLSLGSDDESSRGTSTEPDDTVERSSKVELEWTREMDCPTAKGAILLSPCRRKRASAPPEAECGVEHSMTTCWDQLVSNPIKYLRRERGFLELYPMRRHSWAAPGAYESADTTGRFNASRRRARGSVTGVSGSQRLTRRYEGSPLTRRSTSINERSGSVEASDENTSPRKPRRNASTSEGSVRVHDLNLSQIADYSPPVSTLPPGKSLRAEWKGAPMDLSGDPDVHLLHAAEIHLASVLRLPAEVYLDSKRRLFAEKVHRLRQGLPFRRTDSQKACRIDVNKASRLFGAFERVGWLDDELFERFL